MPKRVTGFGLSGPLGYGFSVQWDYAEGDEEVARQVVVFLEDRRLLFGERHLEDEMHCVRSAIEIRRFVTSELSKAKPGRSLAQSLAAIRVAARAFVEAAGPQAINFSERRSSLNTDKFSLALGELRSRVGLQIALIAGHYDIEVEDDLAQILPPLVDGDPSFIPGFEELP